MKIEGTLCYDPVAVAKGKVRTATLRKHAALLHSTCIPYLPYLQGRDFRIAKKLLNSFQSDIHLWVRRNNGAVSKELVELLYEHALVLRDLALPSSCPRKSEISWRLRNALLYVDKDLVLTRKDPWWAILKVDIEPIIPILQDLKRKGTTIVPSVWGAHISVLRGEQPLKNESAWAHDNDSKFIVEADETKIIKNKRGYHWLHVWAPTLEPTRTQYGLPPRPQPNFHLTLGKAV